MAVKRITIDVLDEGFVVSDETVVIAALTEEKALDLTSKMISKNAKLIQPVATQNISTDEVKQEAESKQEAEVLEDGWAPGKEVTPDNRDQAVKYILSEGGEVPPRTRNTTLTNLAKELSEKPEVAAVEEATKEEAPKEEATPRTCPACGGTGKLCPSSGKDITCPLCSKSRLHQEDLRTLGNTVLNAFGNDKGARTDIIEKGLKPALASLKVASVSEIPADGTDNAATVIAEAIDGVFGQEEDEQW